MKIIRGKIERSKRKGRSWTIDSNRDDAKLVGKNSEKYLYGNYTMIRI